MATVGVRGLKISLTEILCRQVYFCLFYSGYRGGSPPLFRPGDPALCGSCPLVTPYYCRLGDLLCLFMYPLFVRYFVYVCICVFCVFWVVFLCSSLLHYFDTKTKTKKVGSRPRKIAFPSSASDKSAVYIILC